jgi:hypothetical protein
MYALEQIQADAFRYQGPRDPYLSLLAPSYIPYIGIIVT